MTKPGGKKRPDSGVISTEDEWGSFPTAPTFADEIDYLEAQLERLRVMLKRAIAIQDGKPEEVDTLTGTEVAMRASIAGRVAKSEAAGKSFGLEMLRRRFDLDQIAVDALFHATVLSLDPNVGRLHTKLSG